MRNQKQVLTKCVEAKKVQAYFNKISDLITSGHEKVWTTKGENDELYFIVDDIRVNVSINISLLEGGTL